MWRDHQGLPNAARDRLIATDHVDPGYAFVAPGQALGLHDTTISLFPPYLSKAPYRQHRCKAGDNRSPTELYGQGRRHHWAFCATPSTLIRVHLRRVELRPDGTHGVGVAFTQYRFL